MPNSHEKDTDIASAKPKRPFVVSSPSVGDSTESHVQGSSVSENLSLKMGVVLPQHITRTKHFGFRFQDQDASSTQSTGQSYSKQSVILASSGHDEEIHEKFSGDQQRLTSSDELGTQELFMCPTQLGCGRSTAHIPLHYSESYFSGVVSPVCGTQSMLHNPYLMAVFPSRVPLPVNLTENEPIYVNSKQYCAILRRRQYRAKLEAQNKLIKVRKPYLHESRHLHALNRARGSGGRFLNMKKSELTPSRNEETYRHGGNHHGTTASSDVTSASNSVHMFQHQGFRFSGYHSHIGGTLQSSS